MKEQDGIEKIFWDYLHTITIANENSPNEPHRQVIFKEEVPKIILAIKEHYLLKELILHELANWTGNIRGSGDLSEGEMSEFIKDISENISVCVSSQYIRRDEVDCKCIYESDCHGIEMIKSPSGKEWAIGGTKQVDRWIFCPWCGGKIANAKDIIKIEEDTLNEK